jgi:hypothetical protein
MPHTGFLRRQAENCIRLAERCPDRVAAEYLRLMAAAFFKRALEDENEWLHTPEFDGPDDNIPALKAVRSVPELSLIRACFDSAGTRANVILSPREVTSERCGELRISSARAAEKKNGPGGRISQTRRRVPTVRTNDKGPGGTSNVGTPGRAMAGMR